MVFSIAYMPAVPTCALPSAERELLRSPSLGDQILVLHMAIILWTSYTIYISVRMELQHICYF